MIKGALVQKVDFDWHHNGEVKLEKRWIGVVDVEGEHSGITSFEVLQLSNGLRHYLSLAEFWETPKPKLSEVELANLAEYRLTGYINGNG